MGVLSLFRFLGFGVLLQERVSAKSSSELGVYGLTLFILLGVGHKLHSINSIVNFSSR